MTLWVGNFFLAGGPFWQTIFGYDNLFQAEQNWPYVMNKGTVMDCHVEMLQDLKYKALVAAHLLGTTIYFGLICYIFLVLGQEKVWGLR